jgi:hypothetical protein
MDDAKPVADALRAEVQAVNSHKSWHRAAHHLVEAAPNLDPAVVMGLAGKLILKKPRKRNRPLWDTLLDVGDAVARRVVAEFVADVGPNDPGVDELRNYDPYYRGLVDEARGPWEH